MLALASWSALVSLTHQIATNGDLPLASHKGLTGVQGPGPGLKLPLRSGSCRRSVWPRATLSFRSGFDCQALARCIPTRLYKPAARVEARVECRLGGSIIKCASSKKNIYQAGRDGAGLLLPSHCDARDSDRVPSSSPLSPDKAQGKMRVRRYSHSQLRVVVLAYSQVPLWPASMQVQLRASTDLGK